jgi:hypothetical protein
MAVAELLMTSLMPLVFLALLLARLWPDFGHEMDLILFAGRCQASLLLATAEVAH